MGILEALLRRIGIPLPPPGGSPNHAPPAVGGLPPAVGGLPPAGGANRPGKEGSPPASASQGKSGRPRPAGGEGSRSSGRAERRQPRLEGRPQTRDACPSQPSPPCQSCPSPSVRRLPEPEAIRLRPSPQRRCDCGQPARYRLPVTIYHADLVTPHHTYLDLCEACYALEQDGRAGV